MQENKFLSQHKVNATGALHGTQAVTYMAAFLCHLHVAHTARVASPCDLSTQRRLPALQLPASLKATNTISEAVQGRELVVRAWGV